MDQTDESFLPEVNLKMTSELGRDFRFEEWKEKYIQAQMGLGFDRQGAEQIFQMSRQKQVEKMDLLTVFPDVQLLIIQTENERKGTPGPGNDRMFFVFPEVVKPEGD